MSGPAFDTGAAYSIRVPAAWFELDLRPATRDDSAADLVRRRLREAPELQERRSDVVRLVREQARTAWDAGAVFCALLVEPVADGLLPASVTVSFLRGPVTESSDAPDRVAPLLDRLVPKEPDGPDDVWRDVTVVDLPGAGRAARASGVEDVELEPGTAPVRVVTMQTFVPVPQDNRVAVISCSSPATAVAAGLLNLFDAITETFTLARTEDLVVPVPDPEGAR